MGRKKVTRLHKLQVRQEYREKYLKRYTLSLNIKKDGDLIKHLDSKDKYSLYMKDLILKDMNKEE